MTFPDNIWNTSPLVKIEGPKISLGQKNEGGINTTIFDLDLSNNEVIKNQVSQGQIVTIDESFDYNTGNTFYFFPDESSPRVNDAYIAQTTHSNPAYWIKKYGGCSESCVGCTSCNGCHSTIYSNNSCTSGCTNNCASGCTNGCTTGCTSACTDNYEGRRASCPSGVTCDESRSNVLVCSGCNTECNTCTNCTGCVSNVGTMYCTMATACTGCTAGETASNPQEVPFYESYCKNGLNGLYENAFMQIWETDAYGMQLIEVYAKPENCKSDIEGYMEYRTDGYITCLYATTYYRCRGFYGCKNGNTLYGW